ncbi:PINIT domain-containing protein [Halenospora varia]|nr:PINIT domain-containing protein [Halenospora varia]
MRFVRDGGLINRTLASICQAEALGKSGVKNELQARIISRIKEYRDQRDVTKYERLRHIIYNPAAIPAGPFPPLPGAATPQRSTPGATPAGIFGASIGQGHNGYNMGGGAANGYRPYNNHQKLLEFKPSPFFKLEQQLGDMTICDKMEHHRHTVKINLKAADYPILSRTLNDPSIRVIVFCAAEDKGLQDVAFPHQSELKVNGGEIKANLRGLKNKPGSTRPVDITKELRLKISNYVNTVEMTYALTQKAGEVSQRFYVALYAVKAIPVEDLASVLKVGKKITEKTVLEDMLNKSRDTDIVTTASVLSLKCPLSTLRIDLPCRSISCRHNQCFDATSYLQLQEQGPTWLCPICNNSAPFNNLMVDEYVLNILKSTSRSVDQVTIQPDGKWSLGIKNENSRLNGVASTSDDDDDLVEVTRSGDSVRMGTPQTYRTPVPTGNHLQRSVSTSSGPLRDPGSGSTNGKRPAPVIDLTSSGDEDDAPLARAPKRQHTNGYSASSAAPVYRPPPPSTNGYPHY